MVIELEVKLSGQTRLAIPKHYHDKPFWLGRNAQINRCEQGEFSVEYGMLMVPDHVPAITVETLIVTDE